MFKRKKAYFSIFALVMFILGSLTLYCNIPDPTAPEKTEISAVFKGSDGKVYDSYFIDSVGKEIRVGAALYLPANFDSVFIKVVDSGTTVVDSVVRDFNDEYFKDTVWVRHTFRRSGIKNVTITPFSNPGRSSIVAAITILGTSLNTAPKWSVDTLRRTVKVGNQLSQSLTEICNDADGDVISYTLIAGTPDSDTILGTTYQFNPSEQNAGTHFVQIRASDPTGGFSILIVKITVESISGDPPFTVTYNGNSNTAGAPPVDNSKYETGTTVTVKGNSGNMVKVGHVFTGWNTAADGSGTTYATGITFLMGSANVTLYAQWTSQPTFTVTYNGNGNTGGTVPSDPNNYETAATVTLKENTGLLVKTGSTFTGWNTAADGSGTTYASGVTFPMGSANVTLFAKWTTTPGYTVTFNSNGGIGTMADQSIVSGMSAPLTVNAFTRAGFAFAGWVTTPDATTLEFADKATYTMGSSNVILYALWTQNPSYKITFNSNGGGGTMADQEIVAGMSVPLSANTFTKTGSVFAGWTISSTGTTVDYTDKAPYTMGGSNVALYALWSQNPLYKITFNSNGGTGTMGDQSIVSGMTAPLVANTFTKAGATFAGWVTTATGATAEFVDKASYTMGGSDVILYALWKQNPSYPITFNSNGGTGTMAVQSIVSGLSAPLNSNSFTKTGSTFAGWATTASGTVIFVNQADYLMGNSAVTLYAVWTVNDVAPSIVTHPVARSVNQGEAVSFTAEINADVHPAPTYIRWIKNNTDTLSGATSLTLSLTGVPYTGAGNYKVVVKNSVGTVVSNNAVLTINDVTKPVLTLKGASDTTILLGSTWTDPKGSATDDKDGNITSSITLTGAPANTNSVGKFTITYNVSDAASNAATSVQRTLRIEGWENVTTISNSGFRNAVLDGAENIYIASDQSIYKVSNGFAVEINTFINAKDLTVAIGSDKTIVFTYATVTGEINKYNGSTWSFLGSIGLNSIQPSSINIGPGNTVYLSGGFPIFMQVVSVYFNGDEATGYQLGDEDEIPVAMAVGQGTSKNFCVTTNRDVYTVGLKTSESEYEVVAGKYSNSGSTWAFQTLEASIENCYDIKVVNYGSTGYIGYTKSNNSNNPTIYQSGNGSNWTKISSSVANTPAQGGGGLDIAVSPTGELHAAYVEGTNVLIKKHVNSSWVNIPDCKITASFTATGAQNPYILPGSDVCYIVYSDATKIYIKKWKKQ